MSDLARHSAELAVRADLAVAPLRGVGGYVVVTADDLGAALAVAKGCPAIALGGGIEVGLMGIPPTATRT